MSSSNNLIVLKTFPMHTEEGYGMGMTLHIGDTEVMKFVLVGNAYEVWGNVRHLYPLGMPYKKQVELAVSNLLLNHPSAVELAGFSPIDPYEIRKVIPDIKRKLLDIPTRVIIPVGGRQSRWRKYLGFEKYNIQVNGERLVDRTIRLIHGCGLSDIVIVGGVEHSLSFPNISYFISSPKEKYHDINKIMDSEPEWNKNPYGKTVIMFGDVFFSQKAVHDILFNTEHHWMLFGRGTPSKIGKPYPEPFAFSFYEYEIPTVITACKRVADLWERQIANGASLFHLYRALVGLPDELMNKKLFGENMVDIDDLTDDFDLPDDYHRFFGASQ